MLEVQIPGRGAYQFTHVFLDFNGTIAIDGIVSEEVKAMITRLADFVEVILVTADTNHSARSQCEDLPMQVYVLDNEGQKQEKARLVNETAGGHKIVIGNGTLDEDMLQAADLAICVLGAEGCSTRALLASDILVRDPESAFELLLTPNRLISTWRI